MVDHPLTENSVLNYFINRHNLSKAPVSINVVNDFFGRDVSADVHDLLFQMKLKSLGGRLCLNIQL